MTDRPDLPEAVGDRLRALALRLVDQQAARVLIPPQEASPGHWFGGGNLIQHGSDFVLVGRYRNAGDSRTGLAAGARGLELAILAAERFTGPYDKIASFAKQDLATDLGRVLSIEGAHLHPADRGLELFVSSEKDRPYPEPVREFQKPDTGVWSIDVLRAQSLDGLPKTEARTALASDAPASLHLKDPVFVGLADGKEALLYCSQPYTWASSNTGLALREGPADPWRGTDETVLGRGPAWDVAVTRITDRLRLPRVGVLRDLPEVCLYFYDGAECVRAQEQNPRAKRRARGYSCEEIGGLAWGYTEAFPRMARLSMDAPLFVSPHGTGCSRYVSTLATGEAVYATWQQSQPDGSQALVGHALTMEEVERLLG